eukprot:s243_g35.t1
MDPVARNNAQGRRPHGFICLHVDDLLMGGDKVFEDKVLTSLRRGFAVGSEDKNDVMFVGRRITWKTHGKYGPYISVDQKLAVNAVEEVKIDKTLKDNIQCNPQLHTAYRSVLGQLSWLQSRTQVHLCYKFSLCASAASSPTMGDVREINKVPLKRTCHEDIEHLEATGRNTHREVDVPITRAEEEIKRRTPATGWWTLHLQAQLCTNRQTPVRSRKLFLLS